MKRMFLFFAVPGLLLTGFSLALATSAPDPGTPSGSPSASPKSGKAIYSSRPYYPRTVQLVPTVVVPETVVVSESPTAARPIPAPPAAPRTLESQSVPRASMVPDFPSQSARAGQPIIAPPAPGLPKQDASKPGTPKITPLEDVEAAEDHSAQWLNKALERPLSGIDFPLDREKKPLKDEVETAKLVPEKPSAPLSWASPSTKAADSADSREIDELNARLAKIQLEKHRLDETLKLIDRIKSPSFKVKTLVDFAEYVSRDKNYSREAEQLYTLAVDGIDALTQNKPIVVKIDDKPKRATEPAETTISPPRRRSAPPVDDEPDPIAKPEPRTEKPEPRPAPQTPSAPPKRPLSLIDDELKPATGPPRGGASEPSTRPSTPSSAGKGRITPLNDLEDDLELLAKPKPSDDTRPQAGSSPAPPASKEPAKAPALIDAPDETPKLAPKKEPTTPVRPSLPLIRKLDDDLEPAGEKATKPETAPKTERRPMPKKRLALEDN